MTNNANQLRGHCQLCGRQQAIRHGAMAHHGYTTRHGWFEGACPGHRHAPIEQDRAVLDRTVAQVAASCDKLEQQATAIRTGAAPATVLVEKFIDGRWVEVSVDPATLSPEKAAKAVRIHLFAIERRARAGRAFCRDMISVAAQYHGQPLVEVARRDPPQRISLGDRRYDAQGRMYSISRIIGDGYVYASRADGFTARMHSRRWRAMKAVAH